nr:hypothetical protein [Henriciella sp.]
MQVWKSLHTGDRREAVSRLAAERRAFDRKLNDIRAEHAGAASASAASESLRFVPDTDDLERAVREWFSAYRDRERQPPKLGTMSERRTELEQTISSLRSAYQQGNYATSSRWIALSIIQDKGLAVAEGSPLFDQLCNLAIRGQLEFSRQLLDELEEPAVRVTDEALFGRGRFDADRLSASAPNKTVAQLAEEWMDQPGASNNPKTRRQKASRIAIIVEALGASKKVTSITQDDCRKLLAEVIEKFPASGTKTGVKRPLAEILSDAEQRNLSPMKKKTQSQYVTITRSLFDWAKRTGIRADNPADILRVNVPRSRPRRPFRMSCRNFLMPRYLRAVLMMNSDIGARATTSRNVIAIGCR